MIDDNLALRPNCLLTRYPLIFINSPQSLFYSKQLASPLQKYISAHGYQVLCPQLPQLGAERLEYLLVWLQKQQVKKFHFILTVQSSVELQKLAELYPQSTFSLTETFLNQTKPDISWLERLRYALHKKWCLHLGLQSEELIHLLNWHDQNLFDRFLDHCIELAENDYICET